MLSGTVVAIRSWFLAAFSHRENSGLVGRPVDTTLKIRFLQADFGVD